MKHSLPVLVASPNEDLRLLLQDMLGKHGFFHVLEASTTAEAMHFFESHSEKTLAIIHHGVMNTALLNLLRGKKNFLVIAQSENENLVNWTAQLGVSHFVSFPFSSKSLLSKINEILQ
jgi:DNA-binding NtrC family response regulator